MNGKRLLVLALIVFCAACATEQGGQAPLVWSDKTESSPGDTGPAAPPEEAPGHSGPAEKVTVEHKVIEELLEILNGEQLVTGDQIQIDASLVPFQIAVVPLVDPNYVEKVDTSNKQKKTQGFRLTSRIKRPAVERDWPHVRMGDGIDVVATREIRVNLYMKVTHQRPMFLQIRAMGNATYVDVKTGHRIARDQITIYTEVVRKGDGTHMVKKRIL